MTSLTWIAERTSVCLFEVGDGIGLATDDSGFQHERPERPAGFITVSERVGPPGARDWHLEWRIHDTEGRPTNRIARWTGRSGTRDLRWYLPPPEYVIDEQP